jgi:hypothetical protein
VVEPRLQWHPSLYAGSAPYYAIGRVSYPTALAEALAEQLGLEGSGRLLDVGCGPGSLTLLLAPWFGRQRVSTRTGHARGSGTVGGSRAASVGNRAPPHGGRRERRRSFLCEMKHSKLIFGGCWATPTRAESSASRCVKSQRTSGEPAGVEPAVALDRPRSAPRKALERP